MAEDIKFFTATCPAGVQPGNPTVVAITMPPRTVSRIDWRVPNGPLGLMGFLLAVKGGVVLPVAGVFQYVVANQETGFWELDGFPDSGDWQCLMFNQGVNPHSVYLTFHTDLPVPPPQLRTPLDFTAPPFVPDLSRSRRPLPMRP